VTIPLVEQNGSGQSGTATITIYQRKGKKARFRVRLSVAPTSGKYGVATYAHIHNTSCAGYAAMTPSEQSTTIVMPLSDLRGGRSSSTLYVPVAPYVNGHASINVHAADATYTVVACADVPKL
jgi:hypothetical protein